MGIIPLFDVLPNKGRRQAPGVEESRVELRPFARSFDSRFALAQDDMVALRSLRMTCSGATVRGLVSFRAEGGARRPEPRNLVSSRNPPENPLAASVRS